MNLLPERPGGRADRSSQGGQRGGEAVAEPYELENDTAGHTWMGGGCLTATMGGLFGLASLLLGADADRAALLMGGLSVSMVLLGCAALVGYGLTIRETYLVGPAGVELKRSWFKRQSRSWVAPGAQILCLALDGSERLPRRWRLVLVRQDGTTHELRSHGVGSDEAQEWEQKSRLGEELASRLGVPLLVPEPHERARRLEVIPGKPPTVHYPEFPRAVTEELKGVLWMLLVLVGGSFLAAWLHGRGWF